MAKKEDLDLEEEKSSGSSKKLIIIFAVIAVVLVAASVGITLMLVGGGQQEQAAAEPAEPARPEPHYLTLKPMVINFAEKGPARFLQVEMDVMAHDAAVLAAVEHHMPVIRNNILVLLGSQTFEQVSTREGKEKLQTDIIAEVNKVLQTQAGLQEGIQSVYFTSFVMQ